MANTAEWSADSYSTVFCVAGMHCSGASMVAELLSRCGLYLSPEVKLVPTDRLNQVGFWERTSFRAVNDGILRQLRSERDVPLRLEAGWDLQQALMALRVRALRFVQDFAGFGQWGWTDPRTSLAWAFWKRLIPDLKMVICLRNPLEVAQSLSQRGYASTSFAISLWLAYNQRILSEVPPEDRVVTHFGAFFCDAKAELSRLTGLLQLSSSEADLRRALSAISHSQKHHVADTTALVKAGLPDNVLQVYSALCAEAGSVYQPFLAAELDGFTQESDPGGSLAEQDLAVTVEWSCLTARLDATTEELGVQQLENHATLAAFTAQLAAERLENEAALAALTAQLNAERSRFEAGQETLSAQLTAERLQSEAAEAALAAQLRQTEAALEHALGETQALQQTARQAEDLARTLQLTAIELDMAENRSQAYYEELEAIHTAKFWRVMSIYWRVRRAVQRLYGSWRQRSLTSGSDEIGRA